MSLPKRALKKVDAFLTNPEEVVENYNLVYVNDNLLNIYRSGEPPKFRYLKKGNDLKTKKELKRIAELVIPPAWQNVKIAEPANGHLQAVGRDAKNRKQYRYHERWMLLRNQTKFYKMAAFAAKLPVIRATVDSHLDQTSWNKNKVMALIVRIMEETHIRIGNKQYANRNKTYGLTTLRSRHVNVAKEKLTFEFVGKRGKEHKVTLKNKRLIRLVNQCEEIPGWELFKFYDKDGNKHAVDSGMVNQYLQDICGELFTAKDFRTWAATVVFFEHLYEVWESKSEISRDKQLLEAYDSAAAALGNTRNVCRKYYVHPAVVSAHKNNTLKASFKKIETQKPIEGLTKTETVLLELITNYKPEILKV